MEKEVLLGSGSELEISIELVSICELCLLIYCKDGVVIHFEGCPGVDVC